MQTFPKTDERGLSFLAAACYLISLTMCVIAVYAAAQLTAAASSDAVHRLSQPLGIF